MFLVKQLGKSNNGRERCTYLVAHIQQEGVFQGLSLLCLLCLLLQTFLGHDEVRVVTAHAEVVSNVSIFVVHGDTGEGQPDILLFVGGEDGLHAFPYIVQTAVVHLVQQATCQLLVRRVDEVKRPNLGEHVLRLVQVTSNLQRMDVRQIVHDTTLCRLQCQVDVFNICLDIGSGLLQVAHRLALHLIICHHVRRITAFEEEA